MSRLTSLDDLASGQLGYVTRAQAAVLGVDDAGLRRAAGRGRLVAVARGIYRAPGAPEHPHEALYAAWLALNPCAPAPQRAIDPDALVFGRSALAVYGIGDLEPAAYEFALRHLKRARRPDLVLRVRPWGHGDWLVEEGMTVARPEWAIAEGVRSGEDPDHMATALADARHKGLVDESYLTSRFGRLGRRSASTARSIA